MSFLGKKTPYGVRFSLLAGPSFLVLGLSLLVCACGTLRKDIAAANSAGSGDVKDANGNIISPFLGEVPAQSDSSFAGFGTATNYGSKTCGGIPAAGDGVTPNLICPGMPLPPQPNFLDRGRLVEKTGSGVRSRPYSASGNHQELLAQHNGISKSLLMRPHDLVNGQGIMFNATDGGTFLNEIGTYPTFRYYEAGWIETYNIYKAVGSSAHTDCLWIEGSRDVSAQPIATHLNLHDIYCHNTGSSTATMLVEGGRFGVFMLRNFVYRDIASQRNFEIKPSTTGEMLFVENFDGPDFTFFNVPNASVNFGVVVFKKVRSNIDPSRRPVINQCLSGTHCEPYKGKVIYDDHFPTPTFDSDGNYTNKDIIDAYLKKYY